MSLCYEGNEQRKFLLMDRFLFFVFLFFCKHRKLMTPQAISFEISLNLYVDVEIQINALCFGIAGYPKLKVLL